MAQSIEIPVSLGLQNAQAQVTELRKMLQNSVNVKSDAFKDIQRFLDKISGQADTLKGKMGEAFKTPNGSKNFLKQYEQLMGMLEAAKDRFTNLGLNDIAFSSEDQTAVNNMLEKIKNLQAEIANLEKGKIGNLFDDKSIQGADQVTAFIEQLKNAGQDVSKLTFSGLSAAINKELTQVNTSIQQTTEKINGFKQQINILSGASLDNITTKMEQALMSSTDSSKSTFKTEKLIEYRNAIAEFYKSWDQLGIQHSNKNDATGNISTWIQRESQNIANGVENLKAQLPKCQAALQQLQDIKNDPALKGDEAKGKVQNIAESLGLTNFNADSFRNYTSAIAELRRRINEEIMHGFTSDKDIDNYAQKMIENLGQVFNNIDVNKVINTTNLRNQLKAVFTEAGLDIKDSDLSRILNSIGENMDFSAFLANAKQAFQDFVKSRQEVVDAGEKQNEDLKKQQADLQTVSNTVQIQDNIKTDSIKQKEAEIQQFTQSLQELINKYNQANGTHLRVVDDSQFKNGQSAINSYIDSLTKLQQKQKALSNVQMAVNRWMGFWQVLNMTKSAINEMKQHIQELDTVMTSISVVTNFSQEDLWGQISQYSEIARQYGVAIKGVYEVSQIYYQQGLQQNDVMTLTTETLKMARIAGLDYATAADYMTTAIRGFKLEMTDAAHVTDVFSALAATTASSTEEIAVAISKTAASAEAVGASFEATSAMMATMIATTRESATNIGTALKSVISRYGEMTSDPSKTVDSEGEEMSLNRVDKALQTVGITIHDTAGQFRDFDDVMLELMEKWDSLDSLSQRYIATLMAGNRQQSRFLALVSNVDEYKKALQTAMDSEGTGELQTLKTLDSIDAKIEKMKVTIQEFYTSSGLEEMYKGILDTITNVISAANDMPKVFGKIPVQALAIAASLISVVKNALRVIISNIQASLKQAGAEAQSTTMNFFQQAVASAKAAGTQAGEGFFSNFMQKGNGKVLLSKIGQIAGSAIQLLGANEIISGANKYGASTSIEQDKAAGRTTGGGALLSILGSTASGAALGSVIPGLGTVAGGIAGAIEGLVTNIPAIVTGIQQWNVSLERSIELAQKNAQEQKTNAQRVEGEFKSLNSAVEKYKELRASQYDSAEAAQEFQAHMNTLADSYPALISSMDETGNYIIELEDLERALAAAREQTAIATAQATQAELTSKKEEQNGYQELYDQLKQRQGFNPSNFQSQIEAYKTNINTPDKLMRNLSYNEDFYGVLHQFGIGHDWASLLQSYNDGVDSSQRFTFDGSEEQAKQIITDNYDAIVDYYSQLVYRMQSYDDYYTTHDLKNTIESLQKIDPTLSLEYLTGIGGLNDVNDIKPTQIFYAIDHLQEVIQDRIANYGNIINNIADELVANRSQIAISKEATKDITNQFDYDKHGKLISALVSQNPWLQEWAAIDTEESDQFETLTDQKTQEYLNYFKSRQQGLEYLENDLKLEEFNSWDEVKKVLSQYGQIDDSDVGKEIRDVYEGQWTDQRKEIVALYSNQLKNIFGKDTNIRDFLNINIDEETGLDNSNFTGTTLTAIQSDLKQYQSFIEKQQYAQAEAYLDNMEAIYGPKGIGGLSGKNQTKAYDIIKDLDLSDPEALRSAAETFAGMGSDFKGLSEIFTNAALRWTTNAATLLEQLASTTKDTAKSIESSLSDMSKVFKYSEALEKAQALIDANEGVKFDELFTYDKDLGGYIKTAKAFQLEMAELQNQQVEGISLAITDMTETLPSVFNDKDFINLANSGRTIETGQIKEKFAELTRTKEGDVNFDRLWLEYTQIIEAFRSQDKDWNTFITGYINEHGTQLQLQLDEINNMSSQMASLQLESFDYASIVSGKGTAQSKESMQALLTQAIDPAKFKLNQDRFNEEYAKLITGDLDSWNTYIDELNTKTGSNIAHANNSQANRARFESLTSLYQKIASGDVIWDALTQQEQTLLNSVEGVNLTEGASAAQVGAAADNLWKAILTLIAKGAGTINEVADSLQKRAEQDYLATNAGKQYDLLTKLQDGFTAEELTSFKDKDNKGIFVDDQGNLISGFEDYFEFKDNKWMMKAGEDAATVIEYLRQKLGISIDKATEEYKKIISDSIDDEIKLADEADIGKQRVDKLSKVMSGKVTDRISLAGYDDVDKAYLEAAGLISDKSANFVYIQSEEQLSNAIKYFDSLLSNETWTQNNPQTARYFQQLVSDFESKTAKNAAFEGIVGEQFNQSAAEALSMALQNTTEYSKVQSLMTEMGFKWDQAAQTWKASAESIKATREKINTAYGTGKIDREEFLHLQAQLDATAKAIDPKTKQDNALLEILQNYNAVTDEMLATFATEFHIPRNSIKNFIKANDNGTYDIDLGALTSYLNSIGFEYDEAAMSQIQTITDSYLNNIKTATTYTTQGASSLADVDAFKQSYADIVGKTLSNDAFSYNSVLQSFVLDESYMDEYINAQREKLRQLNYSEEFIEQYIKDQTDRAIQDSIELDGFLNATTSTERNDEANKLIQQIRGLSNYKDLFTQDSSLIQKLKEHHFDQESFSRDWEQYQEQYDLLILETLESGGQVAVDLLKQIKPNASADELSSVYSNAINRLNDALADASEFIKGSMINTTSELYQILKTINPAGVNADGVITATYDMVEVYAAIYAEMTQTAGATTAGLNDAYAQLLTAQDQTNIDITEALKNGNGMSYADFGNLLAKYDIKFEDYMTQHYDAVMRDGFGNIRITDWNAFAKSIWGDNLDQVKNTQEYISAFKAYNDGLIELNKNTEDAIVEEIKQIESAKTGDWLNLSEFGTQYYNALEKSTNINDYLDKGYGFGLAAGMVDSAKKDNAKIFDNLNAQLNQWGASFEDGILKIGDNANLLGIAQTLEQAAQQAGLELGNGLEEVKDAVLNVLKSYTDAIIQGIKGGLSNTDASNLIKMADNLGVKNLHFEKTTEGLKLSQASAIELYQTISKIDNLQGQLVFDELSKSLAENNENFTSTNALLSHMVDLRKKLAGADGEISDARRKQYEAELEVAKEIVSVRSGGEDDSFNFMDNDIPGGQKNMINYAKNWTEAMKAINDAYKVKNTKYRNATKNTATGYMDYTDFYNIVNELNNMAGLMGKTVTVGKTIQGDALTLDGSLESASELITKGIETITAVDTGDMMVNIGALGINLSKGASDLNSGIQDGIKEVAQAQISALDGMIAMLELIVAMESLGDIAGEDMTIDLPDIVVDDDNDGKFDRLTDKYKDWLTKFDQLYETNEDIRKVVDGININGMTWRDWLKRDAKEWSNADAQILDALYQAAISTDWNLDDIGGSLQKLLNSGKFGELTDSFTIDIGDITYTISNGAVVEVADWSNEQTQNVLAQYKKATGKDDQHAKQDIISAIESYLNGKGTGNKDIEIKDVIKIKHASVIKTNDAGQDVVVVDGTEYPEGSTQWKATLEKTILSDQDGIDPKNIHPDYNKGEATATVTYGIKTSTEFTVDADADSGKVTWNVAEDDPLAKYADPNKKYSSQSEILKDIYKNLNTEATSGDTTAQEILGNDSGTFEKFIYAHYGIHLKVNTEVYKDGNQVEDPTKDPKFRDAAKNALNNIEDTIKTKLSDNGEGKTTITLDNGYTIQVDTDDITVDGNIKPELVAAKIQESMGLDAALRDTISAGIKDAFMSLPEAINSIDASKITSVSNALNGITTALAAVVGDTNWAALIAKLEEVASAASGINLPTGGDNEPETSTPSNKSNSSSSPLNVDKRLLIASSGGLSSLSSDAKEAMLEKKGEAGEGAQQIIDEVNTTLTAGQQTLTTTSTSTGTAVTESLTSAMTNSLNTLSEGITKAVATVDKSYTDLESKTEKVTGSIRSHWEALERQIQATVSLIQGLVQSLQEKISITWTISSGDGKPDLSGSGSGVGKDATREITALTEYIDEALASMDKLENGTYKVTMPDLQVSVGKITPDVSTAEIANIDTFTEPLTIESAKAKITKLSDPLDLTTIHNLGQQSLPSDAFMTISDGVKAVPTSLSLSLDGASNVSIDESTPVVLSEPIKIPAEVDTTDAETDISTLKTKIGEIKQESTPKILVDINPALRVLNALIRAIDNIKQKKAPQITVDTAVAKTNLNEIIDILDTIIEKAQSLIIAIGTAEETNKTSKLIETIMNNLIVIEDKKNIPISITLGDVDDVIDKLQKIAAALKEIAGNANTPIDIGTPQEETPKGEEGETPKEGETPTEGETPSENKTPTNEQQSNSQQQTNQQTNTPAQDQTTFGLTQEGLAAVKAIDAAAAEAAASSQTTSDNAVSQLLNQIRNGEMGEQAGVIASGNMSHFGEKENEVGEGGEVEVTAKATNFDPGTAAGSDLPVNAEGESFDPGAAEGENVGVNIEGESFDAGAADGATVNVNAEAASFDPPAATPSMEVDVQASGNSEVTTESTEATITYNLETNGEEPRTGGEEQVTYNLTKQGSEPMGGGTFDVTYRIHTIGTPPSSATGNIGLAKAGGTPTLMGELGPELVVSNGRYFVAGQNGAEMVGLDKDAIVFNHLQTEQLLKNGMSNGRGRAVTNERNAVAFAKGNISGGPAMASASAALAALKQIRSMWQSLLNASVKDLAGAGGSGGGGGGGGDKGGKGSDAGRKSFIEDVERWYNLMQEIAKLEKVINHEETLRAKLEGDLHKNGTAYYKSQKESLSAIQKEIKAQEELNISRREYFNQRRKQLNEDNGPFNQLYEFDEQGQLKYKSKTEINGSTATNGYAFLADLMAQDPNTGKPKYTVKQQYKILKKAGFTKYMKYDSSGNEIKLGGTDSDEGPSEDDYNTYYSSMVQAFWDRVEAQKSEMQTLYDTVAEGENNLLELEQQRNELLEAMYDNQKELENSVLSAIEDMKQREIDALQDERDKLEEATGKYIDGLSEALDKERQMYDTQENQNELDTKKRRLGILQRSGASAEDIYSLQKEITESEKNMYFDAQQAQIDAIQQASDLEIERLDTQIQIMQDTLDFQKEMGLLWYQVYDVMGKSSAEITQFIMGNDSQFWNKSPLESAQTYEKTLFEADQWKSFATDTQNFIQWTRDSQTADALSTYSQTMGEQHKKDDFWKNNKERYESEFTRVFEDTGDRTKAATAASKMFETDKAWNDRETTAGDRFVSDKETEYVDLNDTYHWVYTYEKEKYTGLNEKYKDQEQLYFKSREKEKHVWGSDGLCTKCGHKKPKKKKTSSGGGGDSSFIPPYGCGQSCAQYCKGKLSGGTSSSKSSSSTKKSSTTIPSNTVESIKEPATSTKKNTSLGNYQSVYTQDDKKKTKGQASGGYVGHGIYELGERGTETVLTAQQTRVLRNNILSNKPSSLVSLLKTYNEGFSMNQRYGLLKSIGERMSSTTNNTSGGITIENATVNMNVQKIANDYDAKRAGEQALNEMLRIANKTSAANNIRR